MHGNFNNLDFLSSYNQVGNEKNLISAPNVLGIKKAIITLSWVSESFILQLSDLKSASICSVFWSQEAEKRKVVTLF